MKVWSLWAKALGTKASENKTDADTVALIRTVIIVITLLGNLFLIANVIHHW
jgi:hypothetical protein